MKITVGDQLTVEGPKGKQTVPVPRASRFRQKTAFSTVLRDGDDKAALHGLTRALTANAVQGVSTGFTRELAHLRDRLPLRREGPDRHVHAGLFASDRVLSAGRRRFEGRQAGEQFDAAGADRLRPTNCWARWRRRCARCVRRIRTRTRASATWAKCCARRSARPARREASNMASRDSKNIIRLRIHKRIRRKVKGTHGAAAAGGVPQREAYLRAGDRRYRGPHGGRRRPRSEKSGRQGSGGNWRAPRPSANWWPSAPRTKASRPWCSTAAGIIITAA